MMSVYKFTPTETLPADEDNGTMVDNLAHFAQLIVGHRIIKAEWVQPYRPDWEPTACAITLDSGVTVELDGESDCCAYTELKSFLLHPEMVDHIITGVSTEDGYEVWHIYADMGDVLTLNVGWSCGNPFYYGYGFKMRVTQ